MKQKTVLMTTPILLVLVILSVFATPAAAQIPAVAEIYAEGKAVLWCKGQCYSGFAAFYTDKETYIDLVAELIGINFLEWTRVCSLKIFTMTIYTGSNPFGDIPELKFVIALVCGDSVTLYAFGWGCFLYFKGTVID